MHSFKKLCFSLLLLLALGSATQQPGLEVFDRIFGGHVADIISVPYQVGLAIIKRINGKYEKSHTCGGSIISVNFILTAAHCVAQTNIKYDPATTADILVFANRSTIYNAHRNSQAAHVKSIFMHPDANITAELSCSAIDSDVAILELTDPLPLGTGIQVIPLAEANTVKLPEGTKSKISGYGLTLATNKKDRLLRVAEVSVVADRVCKKCYRYLVASHKKICASSGGTTANTRTAGALGGDSGGPFVVNGVLEGVASCGNVGGNSTDCPDLFVRIASHEIRAFIKNVTGI